jgi:hypothetical protein
MFETKKSPKYQLKTSKLMKNLKNDKSRQKCDYVLLHNVFFLPSFAGAPTAVLELPVTGPLITND